MKKKISLKLAVLVLLCGILGYIGVYVAPLLMLLPAVLAFLLLQGNLTLSLLALALACGGALWADPVNAGYSLALFVPAFAALAFYFKRKLSYRGAVAALGLCFSVARYATYCLPSILAGQDAFAQIRELLEQITKMYMSVGEMMGVTLPESAPVFIGEMAPQMTMMTAIAPALLFAFLNVLLLRLVCTRSGVELRPMAPYYHWRLSKESLIGAGILVAGAIIVRLMALTYATAISAAIETILVCEFAFNGFCYSDFVAIQILHQSTGRRVFRYVLYLLFMMYGLTFIFLAIIGLADCIFSLRARFKNLPPNPNP